MGIADLLAECVGLGVLASKMENVNHEADIFEDRVIPNHFPEGAVVVKENVVGHEIADSVSLNDHFLVSHVNEQLCEHQEHHSPQH